MNPVLAILLVLAVLLVATNVPLYLRNARVTMERRKR